MPATPFLAVCFPNMKHSYDLYLNDSGRMTKAYGHPGNAGFEGWKYY